MKKLIVLSVVFIVLIVFSLPAPSYAVDKTFIAVSVGVTATTIWDIENTMHCLDRGTCKEGNPITRLYIGRGRKVVYPIQFAANLLILRKAYNLKKNGDKDWWIVPSFFIVGHGIAGSVAFRF